MPDWDPLQVGKGALETKEPTDLAAMGREIEEEARRCKEGEGRSKEKAGHVGLNGGDECRMCVGILRGRKTAIFCRRGNHLIGYT